MLEERHVFWVGTIATRHPRRDNPVSGDDGTAKLYFRWSFSQAPHSRKWREPVHHTYRLFPFWDFIARLPPSLLELYSRFCLSFCFCSKQMNRIKGSCSAELNAFLLMAEPSCLLLMLRTPGAAPHTPTFQTRGRVRRQGCQPGNKSGICAHTGAGWLVWPGEEGAPGHLVSPGPISVSFHHQEILWRAVTIWKLGSAHRMSHEPNFPHNRDRDRFWNNEADWRQTPATVYLSTVYKTTVFYGNKNSALLL